jgi:hypothetical protein
MEMLFLFCAVAGGMVLLFQFAVTLLGFGAHELGLDGMDAADAGDAAHAADAVDATSVDGGHHVVEHDTSGLFKMITFRSMVAAIAFFGLAGMIATKAEMDPWTTMGIAMLSGAAALYFVGWVFQSMHRLAEEGTVHIEQAVGLPGAVYIPIPASKSGTGKIQLKLQNRIVELRAVTKEKEKLPTGASVIVVDVVNANTVEVELAREPAKA